ncbi:immunity repressor [Mycobacterium phage IronMan]|uniref:Immunity repressor n=1 Tax=Mycobacterium phage IronMan TaxID=2499042 RepID=A0A3S9UDA6_9CAUD|nr:transcriptional repressor [Mycobacterium phage IronMan]AZS08274.1 immunity repressor [Mycobacterium phage IronMan]
MEENMSGKITIRPKAKATARQALTLSDIEDLRRKGYNQSQIADMYGVTRQAVSWQKKTYGGRLTTRQIVQEAWPFKTGTPHDKSKAYQRLRDHGEYMRVGSFKTMSEDKKKRLLSWWRKLRDENVVLEFDPNIEPYPGMAGGGFRYVPREERDDDLLIRVNDHTTLTEEGEMIWCWPPDIDSLLA